MRQLKKTLKRLLDRVGFSLYRNLYLPIGLDIRSFIQNKKADIRTIFDMGANVGQTTEYFGRAFEAHIYAFEPVRHTFEILASRNFPNCTCFNFAFGANEGDSSMYLKQRSVLNSLSSKNNPHTDINEIITIKTIDNFCRENRIDCIDILKTDTEGYNLEVLQGAEQMLRNGRVKFVFTEATMNSQNTINTQWKEIDAYLQKFHYQLQGFFDQSSHAGSTQLDFFNVLYQLNNLP